MMVLQPTQHFGLWNDCVGNTCYGKQYNILSDACPDRSESAVASRFKVSGAFMILTFIMAIVAVAYLSAIQVRILSLPMTGLRRARLAVYVFIMIAFQVIAVAVYGDTVNNFMTCGTESFCALQARLGNTCTYGTSFGTAMISFGAMAALLVLLLLDAAGCCITKVASSRSPSPSPREATNENEPDKEGPHNEPHDASHNEPYNESYNDSPHGLTVLPSSDASAGGAHGAAVAADNVAPDSWDALNVAQVDRNYRI
jgi:hypothetical protein